MAKREFPSDKLDQYIVRFPDGMRDRLKAVAAENGRSLNAEIIYRLQETLEADDYQPVENIHADPIEPELTPKQKQLLRRLLEKLESDE